MKEIITSPAALFLGPQPRHYNDITDTIKMPSAKEKMVFIKQQEFKYFNQGLSKAVRALKR